MNILLLSGGSGKRLWPLSNETRSKQFLKLLSDGSFGHESMVQRVYKQIKQSRIDANILVATSSKQVDTIHNQLGDNVDVIVEPCRRDTFPAIALGVSYLNSVKKIDPNETVIVLPVDPYADMEYFDVLKEIDDEVQKDVNKIVLMGINPTYPSAKYGYIIPKTNGDRLDFIEKPTKEVAQKLIEQGALWNGGVFGFKVSYLLDVIKKHLPSTEYEYTYDNFMNLPKISFDYEVVENEENIGMKKYKGMWKDLGTWNTLTEVMDRKIKGNVLLSKSSTNTHVINELNLPIIVLGMSNTIVAASPDGILVTEKEQSSYLKPLVDSLDNRPMFEEKKWGEFEVLDLFTDNEGNRTLVKKIKINAQSIIGYHSHEYRDETIMIISGSGQINIEGDIRNLSVGDSIRIKSDTRHSIFAETDMTILEVQNGTEISEDDVFRYTLSWVVN